MELSIECKPRPEASKANALRRSGLIPATLYGHKGAESVPLTVNAKDAEMLVRRAALNNTLVQVSIADQSWKGKAVLREVQAHPAKGHLYHLSFFSIGAQDFLEATVPLNFVGEAFGVKKEQGVLETPLTEIQMKCAPGDIPESLDVDISALKVGDVLHVTDIKLPAGAEPLLEPKRTIAAIHPPRKPQTEESTGKVAETEVITTLEG